MSFFDSMMQELDGWDDDRRRADLRRRADHAVAVADQHALDAQLAIEALERRVAAQARQLRAMRAMLGVLTTMLRDSGAVDGAMLDLRLEAAIANSEDEVERVATVACARCGAQVDRRRTTITADGTVCDRCGVTR